MPSRFLLSVSPPPSYGPDLSAKGKQVIYFPVFIVVCPLILFFSIKWIIEKPPAGPENPVNPRPGPVHGHCSQPSAGAGNGANPRQEAAAVRVHHPQQPREVVQHHHSPPEPVRATALLDSGRPIEFFSEKTRLRLTGVEEGCVIYLSEFKLGEVLTILPKCNHGFHIMCIERWWKEFHSCPTCRTMYL